MQLAALVRACADSCAAVLDVAALHPTTCGGEAGAAGAAIDQAAAGGGLAGGGLGAAGAPAVVDRIVDKQHWLQVGMCSSVRWRLRPQVFWFSCCLFFLVAPAVSRLMQLVLHALKLCLVSRRPCPIAPPPLPAPLPRNPLIPVSAQQPSSPSARPLSPGAPGDQIIAQISLSDDQIHELLRLREELLEALGRCFSERQALAACLVLGEPRQQADSVSGRFSIRPNQHQRQANQHQPATPAGRVRMRPS